MSVKSEKKNMKTIYGLVSQNLGYIFGERESGLNGVKKQFHTKSAAFLCALGRDLGFQDFKVTNNYRGIAVSPVASGRYVGFREICGGGGHTAGTAETVRGGGRVCSMMKGTAGSITPL